MEAGDLLHADIEGGRARGLGPGHVLRHIHEHRDEVEVDIAKGQHLAGAIGDKLVDMPFALAQAAEMVAPVPG